MRFRLVAAALLAGAVLPALAPRPGGLDVTTRPELPSSGGDGRYVAAADFDGDGRTDVLITQFDGPNVLFRGLGGGRFEVQEGMPSVNEMRSFHAAWGDMDGDGDPDLFVANTDGDANELYRNRGGLDGFEPVVRGPVVDEWDDSYAGAWGDVDLDGDQDLAVVNRNADNDLYLNDGTGAFTALDGDPLVSAGGNSRDVALGDLDGDGDLDAVVANADGEANAVYTNQGRRQGGEPGRFLRLRADPVAVALGRTSGCALGDVDGDGDLDLAFANRKDERNTLFLNRGDGTFREVLDADPARDRGNSYRCRFGDVDGDGDLDYVVANRKQAPFLYENREGELVRVEDDVLAGISDATDVAVLPREGQRGSDLIVTRAWGPDFHLEVRSAP